MASANNLAEENSDIRELKRSFVEFLDSDRVEGDYKDRIRTLIENKESRLIVNLNHLRQFDPELTIRLIRRPNAYMVALQQAAKEVAQNIDPSFSKFLSKTDLQVGFEGSFGHHHVSPRGLLSSFLCSLVCVEGIVTKCSLVRPKVVRSVHYCPVTDKFTEREYRDSTALDIGIDFDGRPKLPTPSVYPTKDESGNLLETEYGLCTYMDHQTVTIQEMPERAPLGQLPRSIDLILDHDLVDKVKPGDRVQVIGIYRAIPSVFKGATSGIFNTVILANNLRVLGKEVANIKLTSTDIRNIKDLSKQSDILDLLTRSFAPGIYGHNSIKKGLILQLLGGVEKNLENGTHLRGDINLMMVGDPSCGKSQLLRAVLNIAPLAISTTGRGSSGVGLTAAVTMDTETRERRLEAGAMVLADRGVVCIDEFDKMSDQDRVAIHEVMEQQTVTIAKAGIHASLNARCSVVAAANPIYGGYDKSKRPQDNIGLPDSLLSRFDLLFIVLDQLDAGNDRSIAEHVLRAHRYRRPGGDMAPEQLSSGPMEFIEDQETPDEETPVWERFNPLLHGSRSDNQEVLSQAFLKKYLFYAKERIVPELTDDAMEALAQDYAALRGRQDTKTMPVTARSLETIIRLGSAIAKARLSPSVEEKDIEAASKLINFAMFNDPENSTTSILQDEGVEESKNETDLGQKRAMAGDNSVSKKSKADGSDGTLGEVTADRLHIFSEALSKMSSSTEDGLSLTEVLQKVHSQSSVRFSKNEAVTILVQLERENKIMFQEETELIYFI